MVQAGVRATVAHAWLGCMTRTQTQNAGRLLLLQTCYLVVAAGVVVGRFQRCQPGDGRGDNIGATGAPCEDAPYPASCVLTISSDSAPPSEVDHSAVIMYPGNLTIPKRCELPGEAWIALLCCRLPLQTKTGHFRG